MRCWLIGAAFLLTGCAQEPASTGGVRVESRPAGARVFRLGPALGHLGSGPAGGGVGESPVGRTPGPLDLDAKRPARLVLRLPGYHDRLVRWEPGRIVAPVDLEPKIPVLVPLAYGLRDHPLFASILALGLAGLVGVALRLAGLRRRESELARAQAGLLGPGSRLPGYRLGESLGRGGSGRVFRAIAEEGGPEVALKVLRGARAEESFRREVEALRQLQHPNVARLLDWGHDRELWFVVTELIDGVTLTDRMRQPVTRAEALDWGRQVARALRAAHEIGLAHRDLKPSNLILSQGRIRLLDFGLAAPADACQPLHGTPGYLAPELLQGQAPGFASDQFALGRILAECLPDDPIVARMTHPDPAQRFPDPQALLAALE